ncbi:unnamed protein product [Caenorhabditis brenneri]
MTLYMSVHGNQDYINFTPEINIPTIVVGCLAVVALIRLCLDIRMCFIYYWTYRSRSRIHQHLFDSFLWMDGSNFLFSFFDNLAFRVPSTGFFTSWCAGIEPNKLLTLIYAAQLVSSYLSLFSTMLFTVVRLVPLAIFVINITLHVLLTKYRKTAQRNSRAYTNVEEASLMYTTIAMIAPFTIHGLMAVISMLIPETSGYVVMLRSPVTEFGQLSVPLVFSWNNPMFNFKTSKKVNPVQTSPVAPSMLNS